MSKIAKRNVIKTSEAQFLTELEQRYEWALYVMGEQSAEVGRIVDDITDAYLLGRPPVYAKHNPSGLVYRLPDEAVRKQVYYITVKSLFDLAAMGIRAGDFTLPKWCCSYCAAKLGEPNGKKAPAFVQGHKEEAPGGITKRRPKEGRRTTITKEPRRIRRRGRDDG